MVFGFKSCHLQLASDLDKLMKVMVRHAFKRKSQCSPMICNHNRKIHARLLGLIQILNQFGVLRWKTIKCAHWPIYRSIYKIEKISYCQVQIVINSLIKVQSSGRHQSSHCSALFSDAFLKFDAIHQALYKTDRPNATLLSMFIIHLVKQPQPSCQEGWVNASHVFFFSSYSYGIELDSLKTFKNYFI